MFPHKFSESKEEDRREGRNLKGRALLNISPQIRLIKRGAVMNAAWPSTARTSSMIASSRASEPVLLAPLYPMRSTFAERVSAPVRRFMRSTPCKRHDERISKGGENACAIVNKGTQAVKKKVTKLSQKVRLYRKYLRAVPVKSLCFR